MVGKVTRELLKNGEYPWCLSETFADSRSPGAPAIGTAASPWGQYLVQRVVRQVAIVLMIAAFCLAAVGIACTVSAVEFVNAEASLGSARRYLSPSVYMLVIAFVFLLVAFTAFVTAVTEGFGGTGDSGSKGDLRGFESQLSNVITALQAWAKAPRPIHLMTREEVSEQAAKTLTQIASNVLRHEREEGIGSEKAEKMRAGFGKTFDLFAYYGLVNSGSGYRPFYDAAEKQVVTASAPTPTPAAEAQLAAVSVT